MDDRELLEAYAARRCEDAFAELVRRHRATVHQACLRVLGDTHAADDAAQATFVILMRKVGELDPQRPLAAWLHHVATMTARDLRRSERRRSERERAVAIQPHDPGRPPIDRELQEAVAAALAALPAAQREALVLRHVRGMSLTEAAAELGCPVGTVHTRLARGLARLRRRLGRRAAGVGMAALNAALASGCAARSGTAPAHGLGAGVLAGAGTLLAAGIAVAAWSASATATTTPSPSLTSGTSAEPTPRLVASPSAVAWRADPPLPAHAPGVGGIAITADGRLVTGGFDRAIAIWHGDVPRLHDGAHRDGIRAVTVAPGGDWAVSAGKDGRIARWDLATGSLLDNWDAHQGSATAVACAADGALIASTGFDGRVRLWTPTGSPVAELGSHQGQAWAIAVAPDGRTIASVGDDRVVRIWGVDGRAGRSIAAAASDSLRAVAFAADGAHLATAGNDGQVRVWDLATGECVRQLRSRTRVLWAVAFAPNDGAIAVAGDDGTIDLWEGDGSEATALTGPTEPLPALAFAGDGSVVLAACHDGRVWRWRR